MAVLSEDPGHQRASEAMARLSERTGDFQTLVKILEQRAESRFGGERAEAMCKVAEVYEDHLNDLAESTRKYEAALAIQTGMFVGRLAQTTHAYPTWSMAVQQAALQFFGTSTGLTARPARISS